jgi:hypothetical protein
VVRYCLECGLSLDVPLAATKPPLCEPCKQPRWNRMKRQRYAAAKREHEAGHRAP